MENNQEIEQAQADLQAAQSAKRAAGERFRTPWWYHAATGVVIGAAVVAFALLAPMYWVGPIVILLVVGELLRRAYQHRMRVWGYGVRAGAAALWNVAIVVVAAAGILLGLYGQSHPLAGWVPWVAGGFAAVVAIVCGAAFDATLRRRARVGGAA